MRNYTYVKKPIENPKNEIDESFNDGYLSGYDDGWEKGFYSGYFDGTDNRHPDDVDEDDDD